MTVDARARCATRPVACTAVPAQPGRAVDSLDLPSGTTVVRLVDLPALDDGVADAPRVYVAAAGTGAGWRRAEVSLSLDGGASWRDVGRTAAPAIIGVALDPLAPGSRTLVDQRASVDIELLHDAMALGGATSAMLAGGANLALLGDELLQFGVADQLSPTRWRLSSLWRGRRGSDGAIARHIAGERFLLLEAATLLPLDLGLAQLGATAQVSAAAPGEETPATDMLAIVGRALRPPAPVRLGAGVLADGTIRVRWVRRSRAGWAWIDGVDAPLGEDQERYRLTLRGAGGPGRTVEVTAPTYDYPPAAQVEDGWNGRGSLDLSVAQLGTRAASDPPATGQWIIAGEPI